MNCTSPRDEDLSAQGQLAEPRCGSRLITVASREGSSPPENPPIARSWGASSRRQARVPREYSRSVSMTDVIPAQRKSPGLHGRWTRESRVLPSCQANPSRRSPLSSKSSRSTTPDPVRKESDSALSRRSLDFERGQDANARTSTKTHKRNKSDSGIVLDEYLPRASWSTDGESLELGPSHRGSVVDSLWRDQSVSDAKSLSQFDSVEDDACLYNFSDTAFVVLDKPRGRRQRNHSESGLTDPFSSSFDAEDFPPSLSRKPKHLPLHRSLESLTWKDNGSLFPDFLPGSLGAPEMDLGSQEWGPALQGSSRTDSMEHLNCAGSRLAPGSEDDDDDHLNVSWSCSSWRKSVRARSSCSSEDSTEDAFLSNADSPGEVPDAFQKYLRSKMSDSESDPEIAPEKKHQNTPTSTQRGEPLTHSANNTRFKSGQQKHHGLTPPGRSGISPSPGVTGDNAPSRTDSGQRSTKDSETVMNSDSKSSKAAKRNNQTTNSDVKDQALSSSASDEHLDVYETSRSSSMLLPHLQKTLEAVRQHIRSKKTSPSSKIPVRVRQQISPRRHRSQSGSRNPYRRNSSDSSVSGVPSEQAPLADPASGGAGPALPPPASSVPVDASREGFVAESRLQSQALVATAVTLKKGQDLPSSSRISSADKDSVGWTAGVISSMRVGDGEPSVRSPRPAQVQVKSSDTTPPRDGGDQRDSGSAKVESLSNTSSSTAQRQAGLSRKIVESSPTALELSPRKQESSPRMTEPSPRSEAVSPRGRRGENSPRKYRRKTSSRVEYLLSNDLFKKHLSGHIDLVEKNILHAKKFGLKKSFSNLDLTVTDSEKLQAAFESSLKFHDADLDRSFKDESENGNDRKPQEREDVHSVSNIPSAPLKQPPQTTASDPSQTPRRKSIACDDPSLHHLQDVLRHHDKPFPATVFTAARRSRMHIPSFDEFRKQRQKTGGDLGKVSHASPGGSDPSEGFTEDPDGLGMNYRLLDTITEDDPVDTARSSVCVSSESSDPHETVGRCGEGVDKQREAYAASVEPSALNGSKHGDLKSAMLKDASKQSANRRDAKDRASQARLTATGKKSSVSSDRPPARPKTDKSVENRPLTNGPSGERKFTSKLAILRNNQPVGKSSTANEKNPSTRTSVEACQRKEKRQKVFQVDGDDGGLPANHSSSSSDATVHEDGSDGETVLENDSSVSLSKRAFDEDFPYLLFDECAVSMDTESWAQLFTQTHTPRRKDGRNSKGPRRCGSKEEKLTTVPVLRSSSDVTGQTTSGGQKGQRKRRMRKERPYKSDPLADGAGGRVDSSTDSGSRGAEGSDEVGVMRFLEQGGISGAVHAASFPSLEELTEESDSEDSDHGSDGESRCKKRLSNISTTSEDSGVVGQEVIGLEPAPGPLPPHQPPATPCAKAMNCLHCNPGDEEFSAEMEDVALCVKCLQRQQERKETIYEIIETEINYGRDLRILKEEFYSPMQTTGLLTAEQLETVFINLDDLITINTQLTEKLRSALHSAAIACDQTLNLVNIGSLFIESSTMFLAFENYCINQAQASASLEQLERERELLRIFLQVSQTENGLLRRMHLKSFLMVPVQRIMKYPLLLNRLYKATPAHHCDKENIRQAREKIEDILGHINAKAKGGGSVRIKRKQSELCRYSLTEKIEVNRVALDILGWSKKEVSDLITSRMWYAQPADHTWAAKRCRNIKFTPVHAALITLGQKRNDNMVLGQQAAVVLVREKNGKYQAVRDPFLLDKCVVTVDTDCDDVFELQEWGREAYIFKAEDPSETHTWVQHLRQQTHNLGQWRRRRNALPNIMLKNI